MSKATVKLFNGTLAMEIEGKDLKEMVEQLSFYSQLPDTCPECGGRVGFSYREPQGFQYWGLVCENGHSTNFGVYKEQGRGLFYKHERWEKWVDGKKVEEEPAATQPRPAPQATQAGQSTQAKPSPQPSRSSASPPQGTPQEDYTSVLAAMGKAYSDLGLGDDKETKKMWTLYIAGVDSFQPTVFTIEKIQAVTETLDQIKTAYPIGLTPEKLGQYMRETAAEGGDVSLMVESLALVVGEQEVKKQKAQTK